MSDSDGDVCWGEGCTETDTTEDADEEEVVPLSHAATEPIASRRERLAKHILVKSRGALIVRMPVLSQWIAIGPDRIGRCAACQVDAVPRRLSGRDRCGGNSCLLP